MRLLKAFKYSYNGYLSAFKNEAAFRQEVLLFVPALVAAFAFSFSAFERLALIGSFIILLIVELLNSAIEECVNLASPEIHPLAKRAKDMASGAVLLAIILTLSTWGTVLCQKFLA